MWLFSLGSFPRTHVGAEQVSIRIAMQGNESGISDHLSLSVHHSTSQELCTANAVPPSILEPPPQKNRWPTLSGNPGDPSFLKKISHEVMKSCCSMPLNVQLSYGILWAHWAHQLVLVAIDHVNPCRQSKPHWISLARVSNRMPHGLNWIRVVDRCR